MEIPFVNLSAAHQPIKGELLAAADSVLSRGDFILGKDVADFECEAARICGTKYALGVANGTDALILVLKALKIGSGDEVITAPNSYLASASCIALAGATPVFCDVGEDLNLDPARLEERITSRTKAIIPVHLTGRPADMDPIMQFAKKNGLAVIEDAAQAFGACYGERPVGSLGVAGCFSLHPLKVLNAAGDGGVITTNDKALFEHLKKARNHGCVDRDTVEFWSLNSRLDTLHAAMLLVKLKYFDELQKRRRAIARHYHEALKDVVGCSFDDDKYISAHQLFVIRAEQRDRLQSALTQQGIETKIHYPIPIHLQPAAAALGYKRGDFPVTERLASQILSLPIYPELKSDEVDAVIKAVRAFYGR